MVGRAQTRRSDPIAHLHRPPGAVAAGHRGPGRDRRACRPQRVPDATRILQLIGAMLPVQFCIGVINDVVDLPEDTLRSRTSHWFVESPPVDCALAGSSLGAIGLAVAATINLETLGFDALALGAGLAYDLGLRRTPLSWVPWWGGMAVLPLEGYASVGPIPSRLLVLDPALGSDRSRTPLRQRAA